MNLMYWLRTLIKPHNVVKIQELDREWHDRDDVMFHAVFQILVDFVELEQPFTEWFNNERGRLTDRSKMEAGIKRAAKDPEFPPDQLRGLKEIYFLYCWYKDKGYEFDDLKYLKKTGETIQLDNGAMTIIKTGLPKRITTLEYIEMEQEHELTCQAMLIRAINIRHALWT